MTTHPTKLQAAENDLKQLMADVTRAMEKAQEAVAKIPWGLKELWAKVANECLERTGDEGRAIRERLVC